MFRSISDLAKQMYFDRNEKRIKSSTVSKLAALRLFGVVLILGLALFGLASPTHAEAAITQYTYEFPQSFLLDSPCVSSGNEETISMNLTDVVRFTRIADEGGNFHWTMSEMWKGVTAVGISSGKNYQVIFHAHAVMNSGSAALVFTSSYDMMVVGPNGDSNVYKYQILAHYTVNADGTLANYTWNYTNECK